MGEVTGCWSCWSSAAGERGKSWYAQGWRGDGVHQDGARACGSGKARARRVQADRMRLCAKRVQGAPELPEAIALCYATTCSAKSA